MQQQHSADSLLRPLQTRDTDWDPASVKVSLNVALDGCIVPSTTGGARVDYARLVVLDNFLDEPTRQGLLDAVTAPGWQGPHPPDTHWEIRTADAAQSAPTWGLQGHHLAALAAGDLPAKLEVQSRLCKLYPDMLIAHMPSEHIQLSLQPDMGSTGFDLHTDQGSNQTAGPAAAAKQDQQGEHLEPPQRQGDLQQDHQPPHHHQQQADLQEIQQQQHVGADCAFMLANAAVYGDSFSWHVDADPQVFIQPSTWTQQYGLYCNREPGRPLFVSLLAYLDKEWPRENDAETLFLDTPTDTGVFVRPKPYRVVLMDQDVAHRLSTPSTSANRPRYSLVWKLVMLPKAHACPQQQSVAAACIARKEWGQPTYFGSAAHVLKTAKQSAAAAAAVGKDATNCKEEAVQQAAKRQHVG